MKTARQLLEELQALSEDQKDLPILFYEGRLCGGAYFSPESPVEKPFNECAGVPPDGVSTFVRI